MMMVMCVRSYLLETEIWILFGFTACGPLGATGSVMLRGWGQTLIAAYSTFFHSPTPKSDDALVGLTASPSSPYANTTSEPTHNSCERTIVKRVSPFLSSCPLFFTPWKKIPSFVNSVFHVRAVFKGKKKCLYVCMSVCPSLCMYVCMYVCMYECVHVNVCMYVMYVRTYVRLAMQSSRDGATDVHSFFHFTFPEKALNKTQSTIARACTLFTSIDHVCVLQVSNIRF